jgi:hypothetical protein
MSSCEAAEDRFAAAVEVWAAQALSACGPDFGAVVRDLPGVDPYTARMALCRLTTADAFSAETRERARAALDVCASAPPTERPTQERPVPHPLEFYWRNDATSLALFTELAASHGPGACVAYLGMPNAFASAARYLPDQRRVLLDRSRGRAEALADLGEAVHIDLLRDDLPSLQADAVVTDPPWYPDHIRSFLWAAARLLRVGAAVYASFPPDGTRPTVEQERKEVLTWARAVGLELVERRPCAVRYVSSPFELESHRAAGLGGVPLDWRCGDLLVFRRIAAAPAPRPPLPRSEEPWSSNTIAGVPIWVRAREDELFPLGERLLTPLVRGDVLQTVSRRDPLRARVDVWTSRNRVYATSHPVVMETICRALAEGQDVVRATEEQIARALGRGEREAVTDVGSYLRAVVTAERSAHGLDGDGH